MHIVEREQKIARAERDLTPKLGRPPTDDEVAKTAKLPVKQVREVREAARAVTSLDRPLSDSGRRSASSWRGGSWAEEEVTVSLDMEVLRRAVSKLPERERDVVELRYGLNGDIEPESLEGSAVASASRASECARSSPRPSSASPYSARSKPSAPPSPSRAART